jgi:tRNA pseudouridine38-40 synthase
MRTVDAYSGNDLLYLNPKGTIPQAAIIKHGEKREHPFKEKKKFDATSFLLDRENANNKPESEDEDEEASLSKKDLADTEG